MTGREIHRCETCPPRRDRACAVMSDTTERERTKPLSDSLLKLDGGDTCGSALSAGRKESVNDQALPRLILQRLTDDLARQLHRHAADPSAQP